MTEPMNPADVPESYLGAAHQAISRLAIDHGTDQPSADVLDFARAILAAVLPLDRQQQREAMGLREEWGVSYKGRDPYGIVSKHQAQIAMRALNSANDRLVRRLVIGEDVTEWREAESGGNDG